MERGRDYFRRENIIVRELLPGFVQRDGNIRKK